MEGVCRRAEGFVKRSLAASIVMDAPPQSVFRFAGFELDLAAYRLRREGRPVRLERRPMELLVLLLQRGGQLVTREEIIEKLWGGKVVIDFDAGLNTVVRKVRHALGDAPETPAFIETVAGKGYRFIAPLAGRHRAGRPPAWPRSLRSPAPRGSGAV